MKVLVVVDMQNDFIDGALGTKEAQAIVPRVVEKIKNHNGEIIITRDTHFENYLETQEGRNLPVKHCIKGTHGWEVHADIMEALKDKDYYGVNKLTFGSDVLPKIYKEIENDFNNDEDIDEVELVGLCTDICVISNALLSKAFLPEVKVVVDASCCAGVTPESHHRALEAMKVCQVEIINE